MHILTGLVAISYLGLAPRRRCTGMYEGGGFCDWAVTAKDILENNRADSVIEPSTRREIEGSRDDGYEAFQSPDITKRYENATGALEGHEKQDDLPLELAEILEKVAHIGLAIGGAGVSNTAEQIIANVGGQKAQIDSNISDNPRQTEPKVYETDPKKSGRAGEVNTKIDDAMKLAMVHEAFEIMNPPASHPVDLKTHIGESFDEAITQMQDRVSPMATRGESKVYEDSSTIDTTEIHETQPNATNDLREGTKSNFAIDTKIIKDNSESKHNDILNFGGSVKDSIINEIRLDAAFDRICDSAYSTDICQLQKQSQIGNQAEQENIETTKNHVKPLTVVQNEDLNWNLFPPDSVNESICDGTIPHPDSPTIEAVLESCQTCRYFLNMVKATGFNKLGCTYTLIAVEDSKIVDPSGRILDSCAFDALERDDNKQNTAMLLGRSVHIGILNLHAVESPQTVQMLYGPPSLAERTPLNMNSRNRRWGQNNRKGRPPPGPSLLDFVMQNRLRQLAGKGHILWNNQALKNQQPIKFDYGYVYLLQTNDGYDDPIRVELVKRISYWLCVDQHLRRYPQFIRLVLTVLDNGGSIPTLGRPNGPRPSWVGAGIPGYYRPPA